MMNAGNLGNLPVAPISAPANHDRTVRNGGSVAGHQSDVAAAAASVHISHAAPVADQVAAAHRALRVDPTIQFSMGPMPAPPAPPKWLIDFLTWLGNILKPIGRFFAWLSSFMPDAPYARILLWTVIALAAAAVIWLLVERFRYGEWRIPGRRRARQVAVDISVEDEWTPDAAPAREWLAEADALAARGLFAEAVRHLLFRSVEDIARRRPQLVRPALTSRELSAATAIPQRARDLFTGIARVVEKSLFGGRDVSADDWQTARSAYADFALPGVWRA